MLRSSHSSVGDRSYCPLAILEFTFTRMLGCHSGVCFIDIPPIGIGVGGTLDSRKADQQRGLDSQEEDPAANRQPNAGGDEDESCLPACRKD